jgi:DnaJ-class molecular chaperone
MRKINRKPGDVITILCPGCDGSGQDLTAPGKCPDCDGAGKITATVQGKVSRANVN